jgi:AmmeMemoRadiSam system protein B
MRHSGGRGNIRKAAVAGKFYPGTERALSEQIHELHTAETPKINGELAKKKIIGCVVPHAGYIYSGYEAVHFFDLISQTGEQYDTFVIVNPNHTGMGGPLALDTHNFWETPFGTVELDRELMEHLDIPQSELAHQYEHSAEVMIPFLQHFLNYPFRIVPISMARQTYENARSLAGKILTATRLLQKKIVIIASSDFSHYVSPAEGERKDNLVIDQIVKLDSEQVYRIIQDHQVSVCGYGPIMTLIEYARLVAKNPVAEVIRRGNSGDVIPASEVVDYVTILFSRESG